MYCYLCGRAIEIDHGVPTCPEHGPLWKLIQQGPTANVLVERNGKVLLAKRGHDPWYGHWCMPGGFVDFGEHPEDAARREAFEEVGVRAELTGLLGVYVARYERETGPDWIQTTVYLATTDDEPVVNDGEMLECGFFDPGELPEPMLPSHRGRLEDWQAGRIWRWKGHSSAGSVEN